MEERISPMQDELRIALLGKAQAEYELALARAQLKALQQESDGKPDSE